MTSSEASWSLSTMISKHDISGLGRTRISNHWDKFHLNLKTVFYDFDPTTHPILFRSNTVRRKCTHQIGGNRKCFVLFVFVALRPKSTAMVIAGRSVYLTTLFPGQA